MKLAALLLLASVSLVLALTPDDAVERQVPETAATSDRWSLLNQHRRAVKETDAESEAVEGHEEPLLRETKSQQTPPFYRHYENGKTSDREEEFFASKKQKWERGKTIPHLRQSLPTHPHHPRPRSVFTPPSPNYPPRSRIGSLPMEAALKQELKVVVMQKMGNISLYRCMLSSERPTHPRPHSASSVPSPPNSPPLSRIGRPSMTEEEKHVFERRRNQENEDISLYRCRLASEQSSSGYPHSIYITLPTRSGQRSVVTAEEEEEKQQQQQQQRRRKLETSEVQQREKRNLIENVWRWGPKYHRHSPPDPFTLPPFEPRLSHQH